MLKTEIREMQLNFIDMEMMARTMDYWRYKYLWNEYSEIRISQNHYIRMKNHTMRSKARAAHIQWIKLVG